MIDPQKFQHDRSGYERPTQPHQCGRAALWSTPCWQGPRMDGKCGGQAECEPVRKGDRWECRRPKRAGGPCREGPLPDGTCAHVRPPCVPRVTLRRWRGRFSLLACAAVLSCIAAFTNFSGGSLASIDPGQLSSTHAGFINNQACGACHAAHDLDGLGWFTSAFIPQDNSGRCLQCHGFGGRERAAHNASHPSRPEMEDIECSACHTEHMGSEFEPGRVKDVVCKNCHQPGIESFTEDHPIFPDDFPYQVPNSLYFDHTSHLNDYFVNDRWVQADNRDADFAVRAKTSCVTCHEVESATREVKPKSYAQVCARCHQHQVAERELILYSPEDLAPLSALLMGLEEGSEDEKNAALLASISTGSIDAFADVLSGHEEVDWAESLLQGLSPVTVAQAARAWTNEEDYEPDLAAQIEIRGWNVGEDADGSQSIHYRSSGHADPILSAWVAYALLVQGQAQSDELRDLADEALDYLLDATTGPGGCGKCHSAGVRATRLGTGVSWSYRGSVKRPHTPYSHAPHINLLGPVSSCATCHVLNAKADYAAFFSTSADAESAFISNFISIEIDTCDQCHRPGIVRFDCQLCHTYHQDPGFKVGFQKRSVVNE